MARKPPPRKARPATPKEGIDLSRSAEIQIAVFHGMTHYIHNPGLSVRDVWDTGRVGIEDGDPYIKDLIGWPYFEKYASRMKWSLKRDEHWHEIERRVLEASKNARVTEMLEEMERLREAREVLMANIVGGPNIAPVAPKTLEGAVGALVKIDAHFDKKRDTIMAIQAAAASTTPEADVIDAIEAPPLEDGLSDEEVAKLTVDLVRLRAGIPEPAPPADEGEDDDEEDADGDQE